MDENPGSRNPEEGDGRLAKGTGSPGSLMVESGGMRAQYLRLLENCPVAVCIHAEGKILFVNSQAVRVLGGSCSEDLMGRPFLDFIHPEFEPVVRRRMELVYDSGRLPDTIEGKLVRLDGQVIHARGTSSPLDLMGVAAAQLSFRDLTVTRRIEQAMRDKEARYSAIVDNFEGFIYTLDPDFRLTFMNRALVDRVGRNAVGGHCYKVIHGLDEPCPWCVNEQVYEGGMVRWEVKSPGDGRWYYMVNTPLLDMDGAISSQQVMMIDITDRKAAEKALIESREKLARENLRLRSFAGNRYSMGNIVGQSPAMQEVYNLIHEAAGSDANVLIYGESGTGKELVSRAIHDNSDRRKKEFVPVNCGAIPESLIESEFFGYRKGAFTGAHTDKIGFLEIADGGTLFLDEIGEIGPGMQVKLLRAIEGGGFTPVGSTETLKPDIRIIAATHRDLAQQVKEGRMRADFFYRINVVPIPLPPLRNRKNDIPLLIYHFLKELKGKEAMPLPAEVMEALQGYDWPGNVRELQNVLHRYTTLKRLDFIRPSKEAAATPADPSAEPQIESQAESRAGSFDGGNPIAGSKGNRSAGAGEQGIRSEHANHSDSGGDPDLPAERQEGFAGDGEPDLRSALTRFERRHIAGQLRRFRWNRTRTAEALGIERKTLYLKMKKLGIEMGEL